MTVNVSIPASIPDPFVNCPRIGFGPINAAWATIEVSAPPDTPSPAKNAAPSPDRRSPEGAAKVVHGAPPLFGVGDGAHAATARTASMPQHRDL